MPKFNCNRQDADTKCYKIDPSYQELRCVAFEKALLCWPVSAFRWHDWDPANRKGAIFERLSDRGRLAPQWQRAATKRQSLAGVKLRDWPMKNKPIYTREFIGIVQDETLKAYSFRQMLYQASNDRFPFVEPCVNLINNFRLGDRRELFPMWSVSSVVGKRL